MSATLGLVSKLLTPLLAQGGQQSSHRGNMSELKGREILMTKVYDLPGALRTFSP